MKNWGDFLAGVMAVFLVAGISAGVANDVRRNNTASVTPSDSLSETVEMTSDTLSRIEGIPDSVPAIMGSVRVVIQKAPTWRGQPVYGLFIEQTRTIVLRAGMQPTFAWGVLEHERCHVALHDFSVFINEGDLEDRICDAIMFQLLLGEFEP